MPLQSYPIPNSPFVLTSETGLAELYHAAKRATRLARSAWRRVHQPGDNQIIGRQPRFLVGGSFINRKHFLAGIIVDRKLTY